MAQLFFKYGVMGASKTAQLLTVDFNYREMNMKPMLLTSALDNRDGVGKISSRIGLSRDAIPVMADTNIEDLYFEHNSEVDVILVDEAQFLTEKQVQQLGVMVDIHHIPVMCYGLKTDFQGKLFEGSKALLETADKIEEIKTLCSFCKKKASMNLRIQNGKPVYDGETVQIGGNESYKPVCRLHYKNPVLSTIRNEHKKVSEKWKF